MKWITRSSGPSLVAVRVWGRPAGSALQSMTRASLAKWDACGTEFALLYTLEFVSNTLSRETSVSLKNN